MTNCKSCNNQIEWVKLVSGKMHPVDPLKIKVITENGFVVTGQESHFSTCPNAEQHRRIKNEKDTNNI